MKTTPLPLHLPSYIPVMCSLHGTPISNSTYQYMLHIHSGITLQHIAGNTDYYSRYVKHRATLLCVMPASQISWNSAATSIQLMSNDTSIGKDLQPELN